MARYAYKIIPAEAFDTTDAYACRYRLEDRVLVKSIAARGLLQPLIVAAGTKPEILAGHKRFCAARALRLKEIEVMELQTALPVEEKFLLAVVSNWNQSMPEIDKAAAVSKAAALGFSKEMILEEIFPALGISEKGFYDESLEVMRLAKRLLDCIADGKLPFRGVRTLARFSKADQEIFAGNVAAHAALTTNQLLKTGEWLYDLLRSCGQPLELFLKSQTEIQNILAGESDRKSKGERLFAALRALRFPHLMEKREKFISLSDQLGEDKSEIRLEAPEFFEAEGLTLRARIKDARSLERLKAMIEQKRKVLNSLLDIVL